MRVALLLDTFHEVNGVANTYRRFWNFCEEGQLPIDFYVYGKENAVLGNDKTRLFQFKPGISWRYYEDLRLDLFPNRNLRSTLDANNYDVFHVAAPGSLGLAGLRAAKRSRRRVIGAFHTKLAEYAGHMSPRLVSKLTEGFGWGVLKYFYNRCDLILPTTPMMGSYLETNGIRKPWKIFSRGVDSKLFSPRRRKRAKKDEPTILYVGRLSEEKNLPMLAQAMSRLWQRGIKFKAKFVGDGPLRGSLETRLPNAEFLGYLHGEDLANTYANADVFAFPSRTDTFGNVVLEAMASGLPSVVASKQGPGEVIRNGQDGVLAESLEDFEGALLTLIRDEPMRRQMSKNARELAQTRDWNTVFWDLWSQYQSLAEAKPSFGITAPRIGPS